MQTQTIAEARQYLAHAAQISSGLVAAESRLAQQAPQAEAERCWLSDARQRLGEACRRLDDALARALPLPEFEAERAARGQELFASWLDALEALLFGITERVSANNPLVEVLFPHHRFDKLRRGGSPARSYKAEFERRRSMAYVLRLAAEPEYAFLSPLLARVDDARAALAQHEAPCPMGPAELDELRAAVLAAADALRGSLAQARLLAEAALFAQAGWLSELGLDSKPRRRGAAAKERNDGPESG